MLRRAPSDNRGVDPREVEWMQRAVALAATTNPHPNPRVGAVVLAPSGVELSAAAHESPGKPHAEVLALRAAGDAALGATLVTTLEPCSHFGRTSPCTDAVIEAGIVRVIVGREDPDHRVSGRGVAQLRAAGIDVSTGIAADEVAAMDPGYFHHRATGRPRFRVKLAATLDGQVAAADGSSQWITSPTAREDAHRLRARADAIVVGAGTLRADDPSLDVRLAGFEGRQPLPVVIAGAGELPANRALYARAPLIYSPHPDLQAPAGEVVLAAGTRGVDLEVVAKDLAARGILEVLVDGGPTLAASFVASGLADEVSVYLGAKLALGRGVGMFAGIFASLPAAVPIEITDVTWLGPDLRVDAVLVGER